MQAIINTSRPRRIEQHFADDIFKSFFFNENVWISIKISLKFVPKGPINNIPALVQIMAWRRPGDKPLSETMMISLPTHICWYNDDLVCTSYVGWLTFNFLSFSHVLVWTAKNVYWSYGQVHETGRNHCVPMTWHFIDMLVFHFMQSKMPNGNMLPGRLRLLIVIFNGAWSYLCKLILIIRILYIHTNLHKYIYANIYSTPSYTINQY